MAIFKSSDHDTQGSPEGRFSRLGIAFHAGRATLANGWGLILSGEWRLLFYRLRMTDAAAGRDLSREYSRSGPDTRG